MLSVIARRQYTSLADATLAARMTAVHPSRRTVIRFARALQVRDFQSGNAVLLGCTRAKAIARPVLLSAARAQKLRSALSVAGDQEIPFFEVPVKLKAIGGAATGAGIVAVRRCSD